MILATPAAGDLVNASATATNASLISVPPGKWLTMDIQLAATQNGVGTAAPNVTWTGSGTGFGPANGTLARLNVGGLLGITVSDSNTTTALVYGGDSGGTIGYTAGGSSTCTINGFLL